MNNMTRRIFVACILGAGAGVWFTYLLPVMVWWLGALTGSIMAGFIFALPEIIRYSPTAARAAWHVLVYIPQTWREIVSMVQYIWHAPALAKWQIAIIVTWIVIVVSGMVSMVNNALRPFSGILTLITFWNLMIGMAIIVWVSPDSHRYRDENDERKIKRCKKAIFFLTPFGQAFALIFAAVKIIIFLPRAILEIGKFLAVFAKVLFLFIHRRELVLCMTDAGLAVCITYIFFVRNGAPMGPTILIGAITGGLLGVANYQIISKRVLKLV